MSDLCGPDWTGLEVPEAPKLQVLLVAAELPFGVLMTPLRATTRARLQHSCALLRAESFLLFPYSSCGPSPADSPPSPAVGLGGSQRRKTHSDSVRLHSALPGYHTARWKHLRASLTSPAAHRSNKEEFK